MLRKKMYLAIIIYETFSVYSSLKLNEVIKKTGKSS